MARHLSLALLAALLLVTAAPAGATAPGDKASAAAIRQATIDLHNSVLAQAPGIEASINRFSDDPLCANALKNVPDEQFGEFLVEFFLPVAIEAEIVPLQRGMSAFVAKLETIPMRDAKLRSGRAAWRVLAAKFGQLLPPPADVCARLDAWRQAGYPAASRPKVEDPVFEELIRNDDRFDKLDKKLARAGERLQQLGVSERVVQWWTLETLLDEVEPDDPIIEDDNS